MCISLKHRTSYKIIKEKSTSKRYLFEHCAVYWKKNKRVVISNVNPTIPDEIVLSAIKSKGVSPVSNIYDIKASLSKPGRAHILSFRRQVYIKEQDVELLPESMHISYDNTSYWIFLSTDSTRCFVCKQSGHIVKMCPIFEGGLT